MHLVDQARVRIESDIGGRWAEGVRALLAPLTAAAGYIRASMS